MGLDLQAEVCQLRAENAKLLLRRARLAPMTLLQERNSVTRALATKDARSRELWSELWELRDDLNDKCTDYDAVSIRHEDGPGEESDGRAFS